MKNKKKKGFTLIELLAIIVILAIIAVITVPIILNVIENSRKGAAQDSAYGYKDAINKYYVSELYENLDLKLDGTFTITDKGRLSNETGIHEIPFTGTTPTGGYLNYENNVLKDGCITIEEYKVTIENGEIITTEKGNCSSISNIPVEEEIPDPVVASCSDSNYVPTNENFFSFNPSMQAITGFDTNNYDGSTDIKIPCTINGTTVTTIGGSAFLDNDLTNITIPNSVTTIGASAFANNNLETITIGTNVTTIGNYAFRKFKNATITSNVNLTTIYNNTGKIFNWGLIINSATSGYDFETGNVENELGNIVVQKSI